MLAGLCPEWPFDALFDQMQFVKREAPSGAMAKERIHDMNKLLNNLSILTFIVLLTGLSASPSAFADASVGKVTYLNGEVQVLRKGEPGTLALNGNVYASDVVVTGDAGRAKISMNEGSVIFVGSKSRISIDKFVIEKGNLSSGAFNMLWGKVRFAVSKLRSSNASFNVTTATATIGVRGTVFTVSVDKPTGVSSAVKLPKGYKPPKLDTKVLLLEGAVVAKSIAGLTRTMKPGQIANIPKGGLIAVRKMRPTDVNTSDLNVQQFAPGKTLAPAVQSAPAVVKPPLPKGNAAQLKGPKAGEVKNIKPVPDAPKLDVPGIEAPKAGEQGIKGPKIETPKVDEPRFGVKKLDAPRVEAPKPEAPRVEAPKVEAPRIEAPKVEAPRIEAPRIEAPRIEAPRIEAPRIEAPRIEAPRIEAPKIEAPRVVAPKIEAPKIEAPKIVAPKIEAPKIEAPKIEAPRVVAPKIKAPKIEAPKIVAPKIVAPKIVAPKIVAPKIEAPKIEAPRVVAPKIEAPKIEAPRVVAPKIDAPKVEAPKVEAPKVEAPKYRTLQNLKITEHRK